MSGPNKGTKLACFHVANCETGREYIKVFSATVVSDIGATLDWKLRIHKAMVEPEEDDCPRLVLGEDDSIITIHTSKTNWRAEMIQELQRYSPIGAKNEEFIFSETTTIH